MEPAWKHEAAADYFGRTDPSGNGIPRVFSQFELNWSLCFSLDYRNPFTNAIILDQISHSKSHEIAATQFTIDGNIE